MKVVNDFVQGRMDKEVSGRIIPKGVYRDLLNGRVTSSDNSDTGVIENIKGTNLIVTPTLPSDFNIIGFSSYMDKMYYIATNSTLTTIGEYNFLTSTHRFLFENSDLFDLDKNILIPKIEIFEGLMIFCDYNNADPYKINIEKAIFGFYTTKESILLVKSPPIYPPTITYQVQDDNNPNTNFKENSFQFAYRFHYFDGEISAISQRSRIAFKSLFGQIAEDKAGVVDARYTGATFVLNIREEDDPSVQVVLSGSYGNLISFAFDYRKQTDGSYKCIIVYEKQTDQAIYTLKFTIYNTGFSTIDDTVIIPQPPHNEKPTLFMVPENPDTYFLSVEGDTSDNRYLYKNTVRNVQINANDPRISTRPIAVSDNGKYVYFGYNDELEVSTNNGALGTFVRTLHVDENSTPPGDDIYSQGEVIAVTCSSSGKNVYVVVGNRNTRNDYKVARSYDYGSTWTVNTNTNIGVNNFTAVQIVTNSSGSKVTVASVLPNEILFKTSTDGGITFPTSNSYAVSIDAGETNLSMNMSLDGSSLYIGYVNSADNLGKTDKSINDGNTFSNLLTSTSTTTGELYKMKSDIVEEQAYDNNYIHNDIACVNINTSLANPTPDVRFIEVIAIDINTGEAYSIAKDTPLQLSTVEFCNDTTYKLIANKDVIKLYDNVPHKARTLGITQNTLIFGGYTDGYTAAPILSVRILDEYFPLTSSTGLSLKHGVKQSYAIIYYDDFNRSSDAIPIGDVDIKPLRDDTTNLEAHVEIKITGNAPEWATSYVIAKKPALLDYDIINGFDSASVYNDKVYLEVTSYKDFDFQDGNEVELVLETDVSGDYSIATTKLELKVTNVVTINDNIVADDQTTVLLPNGSYIVVSQTDLAGYNKTNITDGDSKYTNSVFYVHEPTSVRSDKVYFELPFRYKVINGVHQGDSISNGDTTINLGYDYDVVIAEKYPAEVYKLSAKNIISNLGRPNLDSDNFRQIDRYAGLTASEVYVQDTNFNGFSSFNLWLINYKDLDRRNGDIKFIDAEDTNVEVYQEDRVSKVMYKKNILTTANNQQAVSQTQDIWGEQQKYLSEYGLSHPESFAKWGDFKYYVDAKRGVVIRKQNNSITPISYMGMNDYFHDLLVRNVNDKIQGYFEPEYQTYCVVVQLENIVFSEKSKGWEFRCDLLPDIVHNTDSDIYSFKDLKLYKHNVGDANKFYGTSKKTRVITYINDSPNLVKVYNAIEINGFKPESVVLRSGDNIVNVNENTFEEKEKLFFSYLPMDTFLIQPTVVAGVCSQDVTSTPFIQLDNLNKDCHSGDDVFIYNPVDQSYNQIGILKDVNDNGITLENNTIASQGDIIITKSNDDINGNNLRSTHVQLVIEFPSDEDIRFESYFLDIDASKQ